MKVGITCAWLTYLAIAVLVFDSGRAIIVGICFLSFTENARDARGFLETRLGKRVQEFSGGTHLKFKELGLDHDLLKAIAQSGFEEATPIQAKRSHWFWKAKM